VFGVAGGRAGWGCSRWAPLRSTARRSTPMRAGTAPGVVEHAGTIEAQLTAEVAELSGAGG